MIKQIRTALSVLGFDTRRMLSAAIGIPRFYRTYHGYKRSSSGLEKQWHPTLRQILPIMYDWGDSAGTADGHYFLQDLWAARKVFERQPSDHLDVGSRIDGFIAHVLTFMPVTVIDIRPLQTTVSGLQFLQADATNLAPLPDSSVISISSLHAIEHFGLGRYGDPIDPHGSFKAMSALARVLAPGGRLYLSLPVGRERVVFNAHRVFAAETVRNHMLSQGLKLVTFSAINSEGAFLQDCSTSVTEDAHFACGMFEFTK